MTPGPRTGVRPLSDGEMRDFQKSVMTFADPDWHFSSIRGRTRGGLRDLPRHQPVAQRLNGGSACWVR